MQHPILHSSKKVINDENITIKKFKRIRLKKTNWKVWILRKFPYPYPLGQKYLDRGLCEFAFSHFVFRWMIKSLCPNSKMSFAWFVASNLKHGLKSIWIKSIPLIVNSVFSCFIESARFVRFEGLHTLIIDWPSHG